MNEERWLNPDDPIIVGTCAGCGYEIYKGDPIYRIDGQMIHTDMECVTEYFKNQCGLTVEEAE